MISGSYSPDDVTFLLKPVTMEETPVREKERLIQSGKRHYSEMITRESLPTAEYGQLFHDAIERNGRRFAADLLTLAAAIDRQVEAPPTLVSMARAGTPVGVILGRALRRHFSRACKHYSISIIRDRGVDENALRHILGEHEPSSIVFIDGWTGKGVIARELAKAISSFNSQNGLHLNEGLYVVADLCGQAACAATCDDYLIPSSMMGCLVSGLISRSILNDELIGPDDFHGCIVYEEWAEFDLSRWLADEISEEIEKIFKGNSKVGAVVDEQQKRRRREISQQYLRETADRRHITNFNYIKTGVGEATRVLLRRRPGRLFLRDVSLLETAHLRQLAKEKHVPIEVDPDLPYEAVALIEEAVSK